MSVQINSKLPRFLKALVDIFFAVLFFACITLILLIMLSPMIFKILGMPLTASIPVGIGSAEALRFNVQIVNATDHGIRSAFVDQAQGTLRLETQNWRLIFFNYSGKLFIAIGVTYLFYLLRNVLQDILQGDPFSATNILRIRRIGYWVLFLGFFHPTVEYIAAQEILRGLQIEPQLNLQAPFNIEFILSSFLILLLAQVWSYGFELQRDLELTI